MHILEQTLRQAEKEQRTALIPFITAGFPTKSQFWDILEQLDNSPADIIEIGVPFSDPVADGPVVEAASIKALKEDITLEYILENLAKRQYKTPLVLMGYYNPFLQYGLEAFAKKAKACGVHGCIVPDLPLDESQDMRRILQKHGIALISLVGPNTSEQRMQEYAAVSEGFVYVVSLLGTTGVRKDLPTEALQTLEKTKKVFNLPVALGFGLHNAKQVQDIPKKARPHAAVVGSALLQHIEKGGSATDFIRSW